MKISTNIALFIILMNAGVAAGATAGVWEDLGVSPETGISQQVDNVREGFRDVSTGGFGLDTLIGIYQMIAGTMLLLWNLATAAPSVVSNVLGGGVVGEIVGVMFNGVAVILVARDLYAVYSGGVR